MKLLARGNFQQLLPILFLCGLRFQFSYFRTALNEKNSLQHLGAGHLLDDSLDETCERGLQILMQRAKSRNLRNTLGEFLKPSSNSEWLLLQCAFLELPTKPPVPVIHWIEHGNKETNLIRFSFGMGMRSFWADESRSFVQKMIKKSFGFVNWKGESCASRVKEVMDGFEWSPLWVLPEF